MNGFWPSPKRLGRPLRFLAALGLLVVGVPSQTIGGTTAVQDPAEQARPGGRSTLPLVFEKNLGQLVPQARFLARTATHNVLLGTNDLLFELTVPGSAPPMAGPPRRTFLSLSGDGSAEVARLRMVFEGSRTEVEVLGTDEQPGKTNYLIGPESQWRTNIPLYGRVEYKGLYPGIDAAFYEGPGLLKYDFIVSPGADPASVRLAFEGARGLYVSPEGDLVLETEAGEVRQKKPLAYQDIAGQRKPVKVSYAMLDLRRVGFQVGPYDAQVPLVIDPLVYGTYLGAEGSDNVEQVAFDPAGNIHLLGWTTSVTGIFSRPPTGIATYVAKLDPTGSILRYLTYVQGPPSGLAVDAAGHAYVSGPGPLVGGAIVSKLTVDGTGFVYSSRLPYDWNLNTRGMAVDADGNAYVVGHTTSKELPTTADVFQAGPGGTGFDWDGFVAKFDPNGSLTFLSYLGGNGGEIAEDVAVDRDRNVYVTGLTSSTAGSFPPRQGPPSPQPDHTDGGQTEDVFIAKISPDFSKLVYLTFVGGPPPPGALNPADDEPTAIAVDGSGAVCVGGSTSSASLPPGRWPAYQATHAPVAGGWDYDGFLVRVSADGTAYEFTTFLGGDKNDWVNDVAMDRDGNVYATGVTTSPNFPRTLDADQHKIGGVQDAFLARLSPDGQTVYASYVGGPRGDVGFAVDVREGPVTPGVGFQPGFGGGPGDGFLVGFNLGSTTRTAFVGGYTQELPPPSPGGSITILTSTERWKPQRDASVNITVNFKGPSDLDVSTVKLEVTPPAGFSGYTPTWGTVAKTQGKDDEYTFEWTGPWTYGAAVPIPRGNYGLVVAGKRINSADEMKSTPAHDVSLVEVTTLKLTSATGADLDTNPGPGGGRRIFPEGTAPAPNDQVGDRDKAELIITVEPKIDDGGTKGPVKVYVKGLDVDDPSANKKPIDDEGWTSDNCVGVGCPGATGGLLNGQDASLAVEVVVPAGQAQVAPVFQVSQQQGDNYRLAASTSQAWVKDVAAKQNSPAGEVAHASGEPLTEGTHYTEMLTVWRTLHLEVDYLDSSGLAQTQADAGPSTTEVLDMTGNGTKIEPQRLEDDNAAFVIKPPKGVKVPWDHSKGDDWIGADLWPEYSATNPDGFVKVSGNGKTHLEVENNIDLTVLATQGDFYRLSDDRTFSITGGVSLGLTQTLLQRVYIEAKALSVIENPNAIHYRFERNLEAGEQAALARDVPNWPSYWSVHIIEGFDGPVVSDNDPSDKTEPPGSKKNEPGTLGQTAGAGKVLAKQDVLQPNCSVLYEAIRDRKEEAGWQRPVEAIAEHVMTHEIVCHGLEWGHEAGTLCNPDYIEGPGSQDLSEDHLASLRRLKQPKVNAN